MTDLDEASTDGLTRRKILSGVAVAAGLGAAGGAGTRAVLSDSEVVPGTILGNPYVGGHLDLSITCGDGSGECRAEDGRVTVAFTDLDPPAEGTRELCLDVRGAPAWVWLRTPGAVESALADVLSVSLGYGDGDTVVAPTGEPVTGWSLNRLLDAFAGGGRLVGPGKTGRFPSEHGRCVELAWSLDDEAGIAGESVAIDLSFTAVQYRGNADPDATNPWEGGDS